MADYEFNSTAHTWGETEDNSGDDNVTVETGREQKETVYPGAGDDTIDLGGQPFGYWNSTFDRVKYDAPLQAFNSVTGEYTDRFTITLNQDGSVTVTDLFITASDYYGTDTLTNVELIIFGRGDTEGSRVFLTPRSEVHVWDGWEWDQQNQVSVAVDSRKVDVRGSYFGDVILGGLTRDELRGREGNDIILGDGGKPAADAIVFAGGSPWSKTVPGTADGTAAADVTFSTAAERSVENRSAIFVDSGGSRQINLESATNEPIKFMVTGNNAATVISSLDSAATESAFVTAVANARDTGHEVTLWFEHDSGAVLLDIFDASDFAAGDRLRGDMGNDFIDGGLSGNWSLNSYDTRNQAQFDGNFSSYDVQVIDPLSSSELSDLSIVTEFSGGTTISDWWGSYAQATGVTVANLGDLLSALGMSAAGSYLASDTRYVVVADNRSSGDGVDILANIDELGFKDRWVNLEVREDPRQLWDGLTGTNFNGTILADQIIDTSNGYDWIDAGAGNDYVAAGGGGDSIRPSAGNDFVDGGATGTSDNSWENDNRVEMSGGKARFSVTRATESEVTTFWTDNGFGDLGLTYQSSQDYWLITDSSPLYGQGTDLVTNISSINFSDEQVRLTPRVDYWTGTNPNHVTVNIDATGYGDTIDLATDLDDFVAPSKISTWIADGSMASADHIQYRVNDNAGDDVVIGNDKGTEINAGVGDDVYVGGGSVFIQDATWIGRDEVRFQGDRGRFEITRLGDGNTVTDGSSTLYDLTSMSTDGIISVNGDDVDLGGTYEIAYLVRDYLPDEFGGLGQDLVVGFDNLSFNNAWLDLEPQINIETATWINGSPYRAYYRAAEFGGSYDLGSGVTHGGKTADFMHFEGSQYDDIVVGVENGNYFVGNGGDDFFNAEATTGESGNDPWNWQDEARYSGDSSRYDVEQVYVKLDASGFLKLDASGDIQLTTIEMAGYSLAIRVTDSLGADGDGTDILVGVERIQFADKRIEPGVTIEDDAWDRDLPNNFMSEHPEVASDAVHFETNVRYQGSDFGDRIVGRDIKAFEKPSGVTEVALPAGFNPVLLTQDTDDAPLIVYRDTDADDYLEAVARPSELSGMTYSIWVSDPTYVAGIQSWVDGFDYQNGTFLEFISPFTDADKETDNDGIEFDDTKVAYDPLEVPGGILFVGTAPYGNPADPYDDYFNLMGYIDGWGMVSGTNNAQDDLRGGLGDDLLFGLGGADRLWGGAGDDVLDGGTSPLHGDGEYQTIYEDSWNVGDRANYAGVSDQYSIDRVWVLRSNSGDILDEVSDSVYQATTGSTYSRYVEAFAVEDSLPDSLGGEGRDILIDIERVWFDGDSRNVNLVDQISFDKSDFWPGIDRTNLPTDLTDPAGSWIPKVGLFDSNPFSTTIDLGAIWASGTATSTDFGNYTVGTVFLDTALTFEGNSQILIDGSGDTVVGRGPSGSSMQGGGQVDEVRLEVGSLSDYTLTEKLDSDGDRYVEVTLSANTSLDIDWSPMRLYDIEQVEFSADSYYRVPIGLFQNYGYTIYDVPTAMKTTIFDDVITTAEIYSVPTINGWDDTYIVDGFGGTDSVVAGEDITLFSMRGGDVYFDGGDGLDGIMTANNLSSSRLTVTYFRDLDGDRQLDDGEELTLSAFQAAHADRIYNSTSLTTKDSTNLISLSDYDASYNVSNLLVDKDDALTGFQTRGSGWFEFADDYYVQVQDIVSAESPEFGSGTVVAKDIAFVRANNNVLDVLTGDVFVDYGSMFRLNALDRDGSSSAVSTIEDEFYTPSTGSGTDWVLDLSAGESGSVVEFGSVQWLDNDAGLWNVELNIRDRNGDSVYTGTGASQTLALDSELLASLVAEYTDGDSVPGEWYSSSGVPTGVRGNGALGELLGPLLDPVVAGTATSPVTINFQDIFFDRKGNDIYLGGDQDSMIGWSGRANGDKVSYNAEIARFDISYEHLNQNGQIISPASGTEDFVGTPYAPYVKVSDTLPKSAGGYGTNYLFDIERLQFSDVSNVYITPTMEFTTWGSGSTVLRVYSEGFDDQLILPDNPNVVTAYAAGRFDNAIFEPGVGDDVIVGLSGPEDRVRIAELSDNFAVESTFVARQDLDGSTSLARAANGDVLTYQLGDTAPSGYQLVEAFALTDSSGEYGQKTLVDIDLIEFTGDDTRLELDVEHEFWPNDWNIRYIVDGTTTEVQNQSGSSWLSYYYRGHDFGNIVRPSVDDWESILDGTLWSESGQTGTRNVPVYRVSFRLGSGDDILISEVSDFSVEVVPGLGDDYLYRDTTIDLDSGLSNVTVTDDSRVAFWDYQSTRFDIEQVWVSIDETSKMPLYTPRGDIKTWDMPRDDLTAAFTVTDKLSSASVGYLGQKVIVGFDRLSFDDTNIDLQITSRDEDWDGDGQTDEYRQEGSAAGDRIFGKSSDGDNVRDRLDGNGGDDVLVGGFGGDVMSGGYGDDVLIGGVNGTSGNDWQDQDRADYYQLKTSQLDIRLVTVAYNAENHSLIRDGGSVVTDATAADLKKGYALTSAFEVRDITGTYGTDILIGVERINTNDGDLRIGMSYRINDWDDDGVIDEVGIEGSAFADEIKASEAGGDVPQTYMSYQNSIDAGSGDDDIYAGPGGDWIRVGAGDDFINGGADGQEDEWGWVRKDEVRFDTTYNRFDVESVTWDGTATSITNTLGSVVFKIDSSGKILRNEGSSYRVLDVIEAGDRYTVVEDKLPNIEGLESEGLNLMVNVENLSFEDKWLALEVQHNIRYRADGSIEYSNVNGTDVADTLTGTNAHDWMNGSGGDDMLVGRGDGDSFSGGFGDDMIFGDGYLSDGSDGALDGEDRVHYDGNFDQYVITRKTGVFEDIELEYLEVADLLPSDLGGSGVDKLFAIENLSFSDNWLDAGVRVDENFDNDGNLRGTYVRGSAFNDTIQGSRAGDEIRDGAGDDTLYGNAGADIFIIGAGNDTVYGGAEGKNPWGTDDIDEARFGGKISEFLITYYDANDTAVEAYDDAGYVVVSHREDDGFGENILYGIERLKFQGTKLTLKRIEVFQDLDGDGIPDEALIEGSTGDDTGSTALNGSLFADVIRGFTGDDTLSGGEGDDRLDGGKGDDTIDGGNDVDTVVFAGNFADYTISSSAGVYTVTDNQVDDTQSDFDATDANADRHSDEGTDTITNVEFLEFADVRAPLSATYMVRDFDKDGEFDLALYRAAVGGTTNLTVDDFESGAGLTADLSATSFYFSGGPGVDSATFGSGDDVVIASLGSDSFAGSDGVDVLRIDGEKADYTVSDSGGSKIVSDGSGWTVTLTDFERIEYSDGLSNLVKTQEHADVNANGTVDGSDFFVLSGTDANDASGGAALSADSLYLNYRWEISGFDGDDLLTGGNLDDVLEGGLGSDNIDGGDGFDVVVVDASKGQVDISPSGSNWTVTMADNSVDTLSNVEAIRFRDTLERLETKVTLVEEFVFGEGIVSTYVVEGTNFDDTMSQAGTYPNNSVEFSGGEGDDTFVFDLNTFDELATILDFEGLDSGTNTANDVLRFSNTSSTAADILATAEQADGGISLTAGDGQILLENVELVDLSSTVNIEVV